MPGRRHASRSPCPGRSSRGSGSTSRHSPCCSRGGRGGKGPSQVPRAWSSGLSQASQSKRSIQPPGSVFRQCFFQFHDPGRSSGSNSDRSNASRGSRESGSTSSSTRPSGTAAGAQGSGASKNRMPFSWVPVHGERRKAPQEQPLEGHLADLTQRVTDLEAGCAQHYKR